MAEINVASKNGKRKSSVPAPKVDLTPMVDLGFLLITFFMFTTTLNEPKTLVINMPDPTPTLNPNAYPEESTITLIPTGPNQVMYYKGLDLEGGISKVPDVRKLLLTASAAAKQLGSNFSADAHALHVLIKPGNKSNVNNLISLIDEMQIAGVQYYTIADISEAERRMVESR